MLKKKVSNKEDNVVSNEEKVEKEEHKWRKVH